MVDILPQQEIYMTVKRLIHDLGYSVHEYLPGSSEYPFVHLGEQFEQRNWTNKDMPTGQTQLTIHVWHTVRNRGSLTRMMNDIENEMWRLKSTSRFSLEMNNTNKQVLTDTTTNTPLLHGIIEVDIHYH